MAALDALADPFRLRMVRHLVEHEQATLGELAEAAEVHVNTARPRVGALEREGVLVRAPSVPDGRGRPPVRYRLASDRTPPGTDFLGLAAMLASALSSTGLTTAELAAARRWGHSQVAPNATSDVGAASARALERLGFRARVDDGGALELSACPCPLVAPERPQLVCELASAVADGALAAAGVPLRVGARVHRPDQRACALGLESAGSDAAR